MTAKRATGSTSLSYLTYRYLVDKAKECDIYPDEIDDTNFEP